jgi:hypothetical protein
LLWFVGTCNCFSKRDFFFFFFFFLPVLVFSHSVVFCWMTTFAKRGFANFLSSGEFSDLTLVVNGKKEYKVHKLILASNSDFFKKLLFNDFKESFSGRVEIGFADPDDVFGDVLRFLYTGKINIGKHNAVALLATADHYLIESLKSVSLTYINEMIHRDNALEGSFLLLSFDFVEFFLD